MAGFNWNSTSNSNRASIKLLNKTICISIIIIALVCLSSFLQVLFLYIFFLVSSHFHLLFYKINILHHQLWVLVLSWEYEVIIFALSTVQLFHLMKFEIFLEKLFICVWVAHNRLLPTPLRLREIFLDSSLVSVSIIWSRSHSHTQCSSTWIILIILSIQSASLRLFHHPTLECFCVLAVIHFILLHFVELWKIWKTANENKWYRRERKSEGRR